MQQGAGSRNENLAFAWQAVRRQPLKSERPKRKDQKGTLASRRASNIPDHHANIAWMIGVAGVVELGAITDEPDYIHLRS